MLLLSIKAMLVGEDNPSSNINSAFKLESLKVG
jgi:hypothetical protein